jgi:hypothetical protein
MPVSISQLGSQRLIVLEGTLGVACSAELKSLLLDEISSGRRLHVDLERAEEIDITILQLLWAAEREAETRGVGMISHPSEAAASAARDAGFGAIPGSGAPDA